jgi:hypothetical protein
VPSGFFVHACCWVAAAAVGTGLFQFRNMLPAAKLAAKLAVPIKAKATLLDRLGIALNARGENRSAVSIADMTFATFAAQASGHPSHGCPTLHRALDHGNRKIGLWDFAKL